MKTHKTILMLSAGMLILALIAAGCQSSKKTEGPPGGDYSKSGGLLTLEQGRYEDRDFEKGTYSIDGDKITFTAETMSDDAKDYCGNSNVYTYQWSFDADAGLLTFKNVDDPCSSRRDGKTLGRWSYSKPSN